MCVCEKSGNYLVKEESRRRREDPRNSGNESFATGGQGDEMKLACLEEREGGGEAQRGRGNLG